MTMTQRAAEIAILIALTWAGAAAQTAADRPRPGDARKAGEVQRRDGAQPRERDDFFTSSTKLVNKNDFDWGAWVAERREAFVEASVGNRYFWYSAATTAFLIILMGAYGVRVLDEKRKLWHAAEILTDCWNQDQYSRSKTHAAIEKYNRHMLECNRIVEAQASGRPSVEALEASDLKQELETVRSERDTLESDNKRLKAELENRDKNVADLSARLKVLETDGSTAAPSAATPSVQKLIARNNELTQQLEAERQKNRSLKGA